MQQDLELVVLDLVRRSLDPRPGGAALARPTPSGPLAGLQRNAIRDAVQPRAQRTGLSDSQRTCALNQDQEGGLEGILGRVRFAEQLPANGQDQRAMAGEEGLEGSLSRLITSLRESLEQI